MSDNPFQSPTTVHEIIQEARRYPRTILAAQLCGMLIAAWQLTEGFLHLSSDIPLFTLLRFAGAGSLLAVLLMLVPSLAIQLLSVGYFLLVGSLSLLMFGAMFFLDDIDFTFYSAPVSFVLGWIIPALLLRKSSLDYYQGKSHR